MYNFKWMLFLLMLKNNMKDETETFEKFGKSNIFEKCFFLKSLKAVFCIKNTVQMQFLFYFNIFVNLIYDEKLNFQHHYSSLHCHMILQRYPSNMLICCFLIIIIIVKWLCCLIFLWKPSIFFGFF